MGPKKARKNRRKKNEEVDRIKRMSMFGLRIETRDDFDESNYEDFKNIRKEIKDKSHSYRIGPAPVTDYDVRPNHLLANYPGSVDGDLDDVDMEKNLKLGVRNVAASKAGCRGLIMYFSKLGHLDTEENIDLEFVDSLLRGGADINFPDRHGQTCLHEIARGWHTDVAQFALSRGANIDKGDNYNRTPLHLAAAVNYPEMVFWLVTNGAKIDARTLGEHQTPIHYAAKYNAEDSIKVLLHLGGNICDLDYKKRTPLFVAAETGRSEACRFLLEQGAPSGVYDDGGTSALTLMVEKMPDIARIALGQFEMVDKALRKKYYYLNYLEIDTWKNRNKIKEQEIRQSHARTPLETICAYNETELIMHPVILRLIAMKWQLFGKYHTALNTGINLIYTILWTILGITMPKTEVKYYYTPIGRNAWRIVLELIGVTMTVYFIITQFFDFRRNERRTRQYKIWKTNEIERDMQYCHERWPEERRYLNSEVKMIGTSSPSYFKNGWNVFEMCTNIVMAFVVFTRIGASSFGNDVIDRIHYKSFPLLLIMLWLRFMRSCQCYQSLGPFITMLGHVITDTMKFGFLFFEFFIPYVCAFWILFGGQPGTAFEKFNDVVYQVFLMTLVDEYERDDIMRHDKIMAQTLVASYLTVASVVCVNLYIALMSQTFTRVYQNAKATAFMQQAKHLMKIESTLNKKQKENVKMFMSTECSPQVLYDTGVGDNEDVDDSKMMMYRLMSNVAEIKDKVLVLMVNSGQVTEKTDLDEPQLSLDDLSLQIEHVKKQCDKLESNIDNMKDAVLELRDLMSDKILIENTKLASVEEIKAVLHHAGIPDEINSSVENLENENSLDDLIEKVVSTISQAFPHNHRRQYNNLEKEQGRSQRSSEHTSVSSTACLIKPKQRYNDDDDHYYRSYSSDSFASHQQKKRPVKRQQPSIYHQGPFDPYMMQEFVEFQKFKQYPYKKNYGDQSGYSTLPASRKHVSAAPSRRKNTSKYQYETDDGVFYTRSASSLPLKANLHTMQHSSPVDYVEESMVDEKINDWHQRSSIYDNTEKPESTPTTVIDNSNYTKIQNSQKVENSDDSNSDGEYKSNVPIDSATVPMVSDKLTSTKRSNDIKMTDANVISKLIRGIHSPDQRRRTEQDDEILIRNILVKHDNEKHSSTDSDIVMGNVQNLLSQYGIKLPGVKTEPTVEEKIKKMDTSELKNEITKSLEKARENKNELTIQLHDRNRKKSTERVFDEVLTLNNEDKIDDACSEASFNVSTSKLSSSTSSPTIPDPDSPKIQHSETSEFQETASPSSQEDRVQNTSNDTLNVNVSLDALAADDEAEDLPLIQVKENIKYNPRKKSRNTRIRGKIESMKDTRL